MPKKNKVTELTVEREYNGPCSYSKTVAHLIVHVGDSMMETTFTEEEHEAASWIRSALHETRQINRRRAGPLVVSLCAFKGLPDGKSGWELKGPKQHPNHPSNPYRAISICIAGCRVLCYRLSAYWKDPNVKPLRDLLDQDKKVVVVGLGIKEIAKKLESQWGLRISQPVDIRKMAASAYGKDAVFWPKREKGGVVIDSLGLEELSELVLDGMVLEKKPSKVLETDWGRDKYWYEGTEEDERENERIMYASRDAFLCHEIAVECLEKSGLPIDKFLS